MRPLSLGCAMVLAWCAAEPAVAAERFTIFAPSQNAAAIAALAEALAPKESDTVQVIKTLPEAIKSEAEVLVLFTDRGEAKAAPESLASLKKRKVIGIGYGAGMLFGVLGLEINGGACAHNPSDRKPQIALQKTTLLPDREPQTIGAFELKGGPKEDEELSSDVNFAMHLPAKSEQTKFVEAIARWRGDENYAPVVRQGNYIMIGLAAPATLWTPEYKQFFRALAQPSSTAARGA